jgi:hypothetical protein
MSGGGIASMSSGFRHVSQGMAGATGAPRPTLVNSAGVVVREHDISVAMSNATPAKRAVLERLVCDMAAHHRAPAAFTSRLFPPSRFALRRTSGSMEPAEEDVTCAQP